MAQPLVCGNTAWDRETGGTQPHLSSCCRVWKLSQAGNRVPDYTDPTSTFTEAPRYSYRGGKHSLQTWEAKAGDSQAASLSWKLSRGVWIVLGVQEPAMRSSEPGAPKLLDIQSRWVRGVGDGVVSNGLRSRECHV